LAASGIRKYRPAAAIEVNEESLRLVAGVRCSGSSRGHDQNPGHEVSLISEIDTQDIVVPQEVPRWQW
jgi:hypothetical protein